MGLFGVLGEYVGSKLFEEGRLMSDISRRLKPIKAEEAAAKLSARQVLGEDAVKLSGGSARGAAGEGVVLAGTGHAQGVKLSANEVRAHGDHFVGELTINATTYGREEFASGHAWLSLKDAASGEEGTLGTWGNDPLQLVDNPLLDNHALRADLYPAGDPRASGQKGLFRDLEAVRETKAEARRSVKLDKFALARLSAAVEAFDERADKAWTYATPCSGFASICWEAATGERLADQSRLGISTPATLKEAITHANGHASEGVLVLGEKEAQEEAARLEREAAEREKRDYWRKHPEPMLDPLLLYRGF